MAEKKEAPKKEKKKKPAGPYKRNKSCPKCGPGVRMADHKERMSCGKCGYFEKK